MSLQKLIVSVIILGDRAPYDQINEQVTNVTNQTHKSLDIILSVAKGRDDLEKFKERWNSIPNLRIIETGSSLDIITTPLSQIHGDYVFYKSIGPIIWMPRHIEHHLELFKWDHKAQWSFSFLEFKNIIEQQQPVNILNWRIEISPNPQTIVIDELCHSAEFKPEWDKFLVSFDGGKSKQFFPGACLELWKPYRVVIPQEITIQMWVDPRPQKPQFGCPQSDQNVNEEVIEGLDGQLEVKVELPTLVGSVQWDGHNKLVLNRLQEIPSEKISKIALKRTIGMGDVILVEPVIRALRKKYQNAEITLFTSKSRSCTSIVQHFISKPDITIGLEGEGELTKDFLYGQKGYNVRIDFDLSYESRKNINYVDAYFQVAGFKDEVKEIEGKLQVINPISEGEKIPFLIYEEPRMIAEKYVSVELGGSGWPGKEWDLKKWDVILKRISELGYKIALISHSNLSSLIISDKMGNYITNPENDFNKMMNYLRYAELHIGADNGPLHIAAALGKKCFIVAGTAIPAFTTKNPNVYQCIHPSLQCLHCKGRQYYNQIEGRGITFVARCEQPKEKEYYCMKDLTTEYVLDKFNDFYTKITTNSKV